MHAQTPVKQAIYTMSSGCQVRSGRFQLIPSRSIESCAPVRCTVPLVASGGLGRTLTLHRFGYPRCGPKNKKPPPVSRRGLWFEILAVTYSGMPERHTTIGAERFHFRVRNGIGWFPLAIAARKAV